MSNIKNEIKYNSNLCIGIDIHQELLPNNYSKDAEGIKDFILMSISATKKYAGAYKFNLAFFEQFGSKGYKILEDVLPQIPVGIIKIADGKRGDIGSTSEAYAKAIFGHFEFDATTLNPYMGFDSIEPFLKFENKIKYILTLTSNKGADDFQKEKLIDGKYLYEKVTDKVRDWQKDYLNLGIVFGATNERELAMIDKSLNKLHFLIPGIGKQGGNLQNVVKIMKHNEINSFLINSSRGILFPSSAEITESEISRQAENLLKEINTLLADE